MTPAQAMTPSGRGYGVYPQGHNFEELYGFDPKDEACNLCPRRMSEHANLLHNFVPAGKPVGERGEVPS
jgi:hypothetical protein